MPARRRAPEGCWLSKSVFSKPVFTMILEHVNQQQNVKLFLREPLGAQPQYIAIDQGYQVRCIPLSGVPLCR
jgi:hypothetical protein